MYMSLILSQFCLALPETLNKRKLALVLSTDLVHYKQNLEFENTMLYCIVHLCTVNCSTLLHKTSTVTQIELLHKLYNTVTQNIYCYTNCTVTQIVQHCYTKRILLHKLYCYTNCTTLLHKTWRAQVNAVLHCTSLDCFI